MPKFDPLTPVGNWEILVELGGQQWTIPPLMAADWVAIIVVDRPEFLPDLFAEDTAELEDALLAGKVSEFDLEEAYREAIGQVAGVRWWEAQRLLLLALDWDGIGGDLLLAGIRLQERTVAEICAASWRLATRGLEEKDRNRVTMEIERPPVGSDYEALIDEAANLAAMESIPSD